MIEGPTLTKGLAAPLEVRALLLREGGSAMAAFGTRLARLLARDTVPAFPDRRMLDVFITSIPSVRGPAPLHNIRESNLEG